MDFVQDLRRLCMLVQYSSQDKCRDEFSDLSDGDFRLLWRACMLQLSYQYDRKGKWGGEPSEGLDDEYNIANFKSISGTSST